MEGLLIATGAVHGTLPGAGQRHDRPLDDLVARPDQIAVGGPYASRIRGETITPTAPRVR